MASHRQVFRFILTSSLAIVWLISQADLASSKSVHFSKISSEDDSQNRIFQTDLLNIVNLRLVPWGNTQIRSNDSWICQHGVDECQLDVTEACAIMLGLECSIKLKEAPTI
ncbi:hypothetical protein Salat_2547800 [Sesamum alatum]|uniref:Uncharacterized protein n=1 Tax=Sesamum alatum TaxID=300844 RepID=A0AAE1XTA0_9LAMI|nr:hypothetical protein Salat_2547800 [Sesamum alatum]